MSSVLAVVTRGAKGASRLYQTSTGVVVAGILAAYVADRGHWDRSVLAVATYGSVMLAAMGLLVMAAGRGRLTRHMAALGGVALVGIGLPWMLGSRSYLFGSGTYGFIEALVQQYQSYLVDWFQGVLMEVRNTFWEIVNGLLLLGWCSAAWAMTRGARRAAGIRAGGEDVAAYFWPTLNNATVAASLRWTALLFVVLMLAWAWLDASLPEDTVWAGEASRFIWFPALAFVFHLALLAQRVPPLADEPAAVKPEPGSRPVASVRPVYEKAIGDFKGHPALAYHADHMPRSTRTVLQLKAGERTGPGTPRGSSEEVPELLEALAEGGKVLRLGVADRDFYRLFSEAVQQAQDKGMTTLVICPDRTGEEVRQALASVTRFLSPEITQRWCRLTGETQAYTGRTLYDLILVEEQQFYDVLVRDRREFAHSLRRTRLVVLIDFHAIDACRLNLGLGRLGGLLDMQQLAVLCLARRRIGLDEQIRLLFSGRTAGADRIHLFTSDPNPAPTFLIAWTDGPQFRDRLREIGEIDDDAKLDSSAYLALVGAAESFPVAVVTDEAVNTPQDFDGLERTLRAQGEPDLARRVEATALLAHYAPPHPVRISIVQDAGNLADAVSGRYGFHHGMEDRLVHVVSWPYPARDFALDWLSADAAGFSSAVAPFAQKPDIGLTELATRIENAMREADGLDEPDLMDLLSRASGDLPKDLGLTATRNGLIGLFRSIDPKFQPTAIRHKTAGDQTHRFYLDPAYRVSGVTHTADVMEAGVHIGVLSPRDEGLTYVRNAPIYMNGQFHRIERIDPDNRRVIVTPVGRQALTHGRRCRNLFQRTYTLDLKSFAREQEDDEFLGANRGSHLYRMHIHASVERYSDMHLVWPVDEPLLSTETRANPSSENIRQVRPYRGVYLIALRTKAEEAARAYPPIVARTLAASLQDTLALLFPALMERIAAVAIGDAAAEYSPQYERLAFGYPRGRIVNDTVEGALRTVMRRAGMQEPARLGEAWAGADLAVIEDADGDIGVVRRLHDNWSELLPIWQAYLTWATGQPLWQREEGAFDASAALQLSLFGGER